jgi:hypothetical protein
MDLCTKVRRLGPDRVVAVLVNVASIAVHGFAGQAEVPRHYPLIIETGNTALFTRDLLNEQLIAACNYRWRVLKHVTPPPSLEPGRVTILAGLVCGLRCQVRYHHRHAYSLFCIF